MKKRPTIHSMKRRARWHNYAAKGIYMLTMVTEHRYRLLGTLVGEPYPQILMSTLGREVLSTALYRVHEAYPNTEVWKATIMPDHIHIIINVAEDFEEGMHLGKVVAMFKTRCTQAYRRIYNKPDGSLFEKGYNDRILHEGEQLQRWKRYLADNPRRLFLKRQHPDLFRSIQDVEVCGRKCQLFGNLFLLDIPDKEAVIVHRRDTDEEYALKFKQWMACGERGGVLVSAAISPREKAVMREAMNRGYSIIRLCDNGFPALYKPPGEFFDACAQGQLLEVSPLPYTPNKGKITRAECIALNAFAEAIADGKAACH